jgi:hypothetical protein
MAVIQKRKNSKYSTGFGDLKIRSYNKKYVYIISNVFDWLVAWWSFAVVKVF